MVQTCNLLFVEIETGGLKTYQKIGSSYLKLWFGTFPTQSVVHNETAVVYTHHSLKSDLSGEGLRPVTPAFRGCGLRGPVSILLFLLF